MQLRGRIVCFAGFDISPGKYRAGHRRHDQYSNDSFHNLSMYQVQKGLPPDEQEGHSGRFYCYKVTADALLLVVISGVFAVCFNEMVTPSFPVLC